MRPPRPNEDANAVSNAGLHPGPNTGASPGDPPASVYIITGEHSGDALGAKLMASLRARSDRVLTFEGLGGHAMQREGLTPLYPLDEVTVMGPVAILKAYPRLRRRALEVVADALARRPDLVIIIDAPEFTHPIAKRIRKANPDLPIVGYVSPSVWAWRPGRARKMRPYVDHLMALLPFEPAAHERLNGPPCTYVGHPLSERREQVLTLDPAPLAQRLGLDPAKPVLVVLPGSRSSEVQHLMAPFGETVRQLDGDGHALEVIIPAVARQRDTIAAAARDWPVQPHLVDGEADKWRAFKLARCALAASGTVTLELAVAGVPAVVAYKVDRLAAMLRFLVNVPSIVLANLVLDDAVYPEFIQEDCAAATLAPAVADLLVDGRPRQRQLAGLARLPAKLSTGDLAPSERAADVVLEVLNR